jgi:hypothetical protein
MPVDDAGLRLPRLEGIDDGLPVVCAGMGIREAKSEGAAVRGDTEAGVEVVDRCARPSGPSDQPASEAGDRDTALAVKDE